MIPTALSRFVWITPRDRRRDAGPIDDLVPMPDGAGARLAYTARPRAGRAAMFVLAASGAGLAGAAPVLAVAGHAGFALAAALVGALYVGALRLTAILRSRDRTLAIHGAFLSRLPTARVEKLRRNPAIAAMRFAQALAALHALPTAIDAIAGTAFRAALPLAAGLWLASDARGIAWLITGSALLLGAFAGMLAERRLLAATFRLDIADAAFARRVGRFVTAWPTMRDLGASVAATERLRRSHPIAAAAHAARATLCVSALFRLAVPAVPIAVLLVSPDLSANAIAGVAIAAVVAAQAGLSLGVQSARAIQARHRRHAADRLFPGDEVAALPIDRLDSLELRNLSFRYPGMAKPVFDALDLSLRRGDSVALASPSGSGKTTLLRVIAGLAEPGSGTVMVNGQDARSTAYRHRIAAVFQDEPIGAGTIRSAIAGGNPMGLDEVWAVAERVGIADMIRALPMEMQTLIVEGPFPPSLLQPLLIARALAQRPDLLVLDEALGALPHDRARDLLATLRRDGVITLFASHDPRLVALADTVLVLGRD